MKRLLRAKWLKLIFLGFIALILSLPSIAKEANAQGSSPLCAPQPASTPTPMGCCGPVPASPVPATSLSVTRHGILAKGSLVTTSVIGNGRVETTRTFTSKDLLNTYGQPTISWSESSPAPEGITMTSTSSQNTALFVLRQDETPLASTSSAVGGSSIKPSSIFDGNGLIYPQWTYIRSGGACSGFFYVQEDPINFAYEPHPLNDIVSFLMNSRGWYDSGSCSGAAYIYDFSGYGWKVYDRTLGAVNGCFSTDYGRVHARFFVMANGRIAAPAHQELWSNQCF